MNKLYLALLCLALHINGFSQDINYNYSKNTKLYAWIDKVRIRAIPEKNAAAIGHLAEGEKVTFLGKRGGKKTYFTLRGKGFNTDFLEVRIDRTGKKGWVYAGALQDEKPLSHTAKINIKRNLKNLVRKVDQVIQKEQPWETANSKNYYSLWHPKQNGKTVFYKQTGYTAVGNREEEIYTSSGYAGIAKDDVDSIYLLKKESINYQKKKYRYGMKKNDIKKFIGSPTFETENILYYEAQSPDSGDSFISGYFFIFNKNKLSFVKINYCMGD